VPAISRAIPWARVFAIARIVADRVGEDVPQKDRKRVAALLKVSKGDPRKLTANERRELLRILRQVDYGKLGREVAAAAAAARLLKR
jgi:transposase